MTNGFFFLLTIKYPIFMFKKRLPIVPEFAEMRLDAMLSLERRHAKRVLNVIDDVVRK